MAEATSIVERIAEACAEHAKPAGFVPSYGTAGFRADASLLQSTTFRCGVVAALRALHVGSSCGIMVTASHNVHTDNGVKLVDSNGGMLVQEWEPLATALAQADSQEELTAALQALLPLVLQPPPNCSVVVGHDTRSSSPTLAAIAAQGVALMNLPVHHIGCVTTPQLHFVVVQLNTMGRLDSREYFRTLLSGFEALWGLPGGSKVQAEPAGTPAAEFVGTLAAKPVGTAAAEPPSTLAAKPACNPAGEPAGNQFGGTLAAAALPAGAAGLAGTLAVAGLTAGAAAVVGTGVAAAVAAESQLASAWASTRTSAGTTMDVLPKGSPAGETVGETVDVLSACSQPAAATAVPAAVVVDCANGVGAVHLKKMMEIMGPGRLALELRNTGEGVLNQGVGADFVQKEKRLPRGFDGVMPGDRCCSMDGDADRLVYFTVGEDGSFRLLDGDRIAALAAAFVQELLQELPQALASTITVGVVQTAYANGASTRYITKVLRLPVVVTKTGVKHLHVAAHKFDVGIYFEANGHGTVLISDPLTAKLQQVAGSCPAASKLLAMRHMVNQNVGDAFSGILMVEVILRHFGWSLETWLSVYSDVPSRQSKLKVADRSVITTSTDDTQCLAPTGVQEAIDQACAKYQLSRAFVRPSGTEDIVRVYAEADTQEAADSLAQDVMQVVYDLAGGIGASP